mgnify:CR=1 FL=1
MNTHGFDDDDFEFDQPEWNKKEMDEQIRRMREALRGGEARHEPTPLSASASDECPSPMSK